LVDINQGVSRLTNSHAAVKIQVSTVGQVACP